MSPFESVEISLTVTVPATINRQRLHQWLVTDGLRFGQTDAAGMTTSGTATDPVRQFLSDWLFFHQNILIDAGFPCFKPTEIRQIQQVADRRYRLLLVVYLIAEHQSPVVNSLSSCLSLVQAMNSTPFDADAYAALSGKIHEQLYKPLHQASNAGLSTLHVLRYAFEQDIPFVHLGAGVYQLGWGKNSHLLHKSRTEQDSAIGATLSGYKSLTADRLRRMGLPAADNRLTDSLDKAQQIARDLGYPVVIKPEQGNRGEGVVKDIYTDEQLRRAWPLATAFNSLVLVERQVKGTCYRLFVYDGEVMFVKATLPRMLTGDGRSTLAELMAADAARQQKRRPWQRDPVIPLDEETLACFRAQGVAPETVLVEQQAIYVRKVGSLQWGVANIPAASHVHPANLRLAVDATRAMNLCTAGVDLIIADIARPWYEQDCIVNEVNSSPMIGVSDASLQCLPKLMARMLTDDGRIPVSLYVGQQKAFAAGGQEQQRRIAAGQACFLTTDKVTYDGTGQQKAMTHTTLAQRCRALLMDPMVEALILVIQNSGLLTTGLPVDQVQQLVCTDEGLCDSAGQLVSRREYDAVLGVLKKIEKA